MEAHGEGTHDTVWRGDGEAWRGIWGGMARYGEVQRGEERGGGRGYPARARAILT